MIPRVSKVDRGGGTPTAPAAATRDVATFKSSDGGRTWEVARVQKGQRENESYYDPHLAYGPDGSVYQVAMRNNSRKANAGAIEVSRSGDGGKTWDRHTSLRFADRPFLVADCTGGTGHGLLHCFAANHFGNAVVGESRHGKAAFPGSKGNLPFFPDFQAALPTDGRCT